MRRSKKGTSDSLNVCETAKKYARRLQPLFACARVRGDVALFFLEPFARYTNRRLFRGRRARAFFVSTAIAGVAFKFARLISAATRVVRSAGRCSLSLRRRREAVMTATATTTTIGDDERRRPRQALRNERRVARPSKRRQQPPLPPPLPRPSAAAARTCPLTLGDGSCDRRRRDRRRRDRRRCALCRRRRRRRGTRLARPSPSLSSPAATAVARRSACPSRARSPHLDHSKPHARRRRRRRRRRHRRHPTLARCWTPVAVAASRRSSGATHQHDRRFLVSCVCVC